MKVFRVFFIAIIVISFLELYVLMAVGSLLGVFITLLLVIVTAAFGSFLLKQQGLATWQRFQMALARQEVPAFELAEGFLILLGGALLLTPGFITDIAGLLLLLPSFRNKLIAYLTRHYSAPSPQAAKDAIEGEFRKE
jgi:UPF0716 protein FxsA